MLFHDLTYAFRTLRKSPVFAVTAVVTIALGIGASTAIFSVTNAVLLRSLPYKQPERLVLACNDMRRRNVKDFPFSNADFLDLRNGAHSAFEDLGAVNTGRGPVGRADGTLEQVRFAGVSTNFFRLMGAAIAFGRDFQDSDGLPQPALPQAGAAPGAPPQRLPVFAILSHEYFERRFGGDRSVLGQVLPVTGGPSPIVVGVLAPGCELLFPPEANEEQSPDIWAAARIPHDTANRNNVQWRVIGRLRTNVTIERAQAEAESVAERIRSVNPISRTAGQYIRIEPMKRHLVSQVR
ncbi:MAG TPA: ABC transporter permease, partial [Bryobacteraceae bacterium]|nr:ABC transporter permease [Bryobacteraceae bacterium]